MVRAVYLITKFIEFFIFFIFGKKLSKAKNEETYWTLASAPIVVYTFFEGLRFGRGIDWNLYYHRFVNIGESFANEDYEPIFEFICHVFYNVGIPYFIFITLISGLLIYATISLLWNYKDKMQYSLLIFLLVTASAENYIRWYFAFAFCILALDSYIRKRPWGITLAYSTVAFLCHNGVFVLYMFAFLYKVLNKRTLPPYISLIMVFLSTYLLSITLFSFISDITQYMSLLGIGEDLTVSTYMDNVDDIISGKFGSFGSMDASFVKKTLLFLTWVPIILFGKKAMKDSKGGIYMYNLFIIGAFISPLFKTVEIFDRYADSFLFFECIVGSAVYMKYIHFKYRRKVVCLLCTLSFVCLLTGARSIINTKNEYRMLFMWDAEGREYLETYDILKSE